LLNYDQKLTIDDVVEIRKQSVLEEAEKPEDEPKEGTIKVLSLTAGPRLVGCGIKVSEVMDSKEQRAATTREEITKMLACFEDRLKENKRFLSRQISMFDFFKPSFIAVCIFGH
jgi:hypothetical protein